MMTIPYQLVSGIMLVPATANGQEGYFAFDTGAMQTAVNKAHFPELNGEHVDIAKFSEEVMESSADRGVLDTLQIVGMERAALPVLIMDLMYVENALKPLLPELKLLGTLGIDVIGGYTVLLDYQAQEIVLDPQQGFAHQRIVPMRFDQLPVIKVEAAGRVCDFVLDTGANTCLLGQSFLQNPQLTPAAETPNIVNIPSLRVGENEYSNITAVVSDISAIQKRVPVEGVIGYQILCQQRVILDFWHQRMLMEMA